MLVRPVYSSGDVSTAATRGTSDGHHVETHIQRPRCNKQFGDFGRATRIPAEDFARLDVARPGLADSIMEFVVNGQGQEVLDRLAATPGCGKALDLAGCSMLSGVNRAARARFFANPPAANPLFFLRLARVYDAAARPDRIVTPNYPSLGLPDWIELLLWEATSSSPYMYSSVEPKSRFHDMMEQVGLSPAGSPRILTRAVTDASAETGSS